MINESAVSQSVESSETVQEYDTLPGEMSMDSGVVVVDNDSGDEKTKFTDDNHIAEKGRG